MKNTIAVLIASLAACGCSGITATQTMPDGSVNRISIGSQVSKTTLRNLKSPLLSIQGMGTDMTAQLEPLVNAIAAGVAQGLQAQAAKEREAQK